MWRRAWNEVIARPRVLLGFAIGLQLTLFVVAQRDIPGDDALAYTQEAYAITQDPAGYFAAPGNHPFTMRIGITLPLAAMIALFGVSQTTTNLPCLLAAIAILLVVYAAAPTPRAKRLGLGLAATSTALLTYGTELNADLLCGAASAVSLLLLSRGQRSAAVAVWFFAFLVKETTIWFAPAWVYVIALDARTLGWRTTLRRFAPALALGTALVMAYVVVCAALWHDPLARMTGINALAGDHLWTPRGRSTSWWIARLTWGPWKAFLLTFGISFVIALAGSRRLRGAERIWPVALGSCVVMLWFGSASTRAYVPLPLWPPRMLMIGLPCVLVVATLAADRLRWRRWVAAVAVAAAVIPFGRALVRVRAGHPEQEVARAIHADLAAPGEVVVVCPDFRCMTTTWFELGFRVPSSLHVVGAADFARAPPPRPGTRVRVVARRARPRVALEVDAAAIDGLALPRIYGHRDLRLYDAGDGTRLHHALRALRAP